MHSHRAFFAGLASVVLCVAAATAVGCGDGAGTGDTGAAATPPDTSLDRALPPREPLAASRSDTVRIDRFDLPSADAECSDTDGGGPKRPPYDENAWVELDLEAKRLAGGRRCRGDAGHETGAEIALSDAQRDELWDSLAELQVAHPIECGCCDGTAYLMTITSPGKPSVTYGSGIAGISDCARVVDSSGLYARAARMLQQ